MPAEASRELAIRFITTMRKHNGPDVSLLTEDFQWWASYHHDVMNTRQIKAMCASLTHLDGLPEMTVIGSVAEQNRVAIEAKGKCQMTDGTPYNNHYHFVVVLRDGRICEVREYTDTKLASSNLGGRDPAEVTRAFAHL